MLISLDPNSFERIKDCLACVKEMQLKLIECGNGFPKKDRNIIELVLMNLRTSYNLFCSSFRNNSLSHKEDGKGYSFDVFFDLLITDQ